eukprot:5118959-Amphidinium_carterae.1
MPLVAHLEKVSSLTCHLSLRCHLVLAQYTARAIPCSCLQAHHACRHGRQAAFIAATSGVGGLVADQHSQKMIT